MLLSRALLLLLPWVGAASLAEFAPEGVTSMKAAAGNWTADRAQRATHVVLVVFDDLGWGDVGYHGSNFPTPHIDKLANSGVRLGRAYVMPQCSPTRAAVMTGRYSFRTGLQHFQTIMPGAMPGIPADVPTLAETFRQAGYATHMIGKWHLGYASWEQTPLGKGFDSFYGYLQGQVNYYNRTVPSCMGLICQYPANRGVESPFGAGAAGYDFWDDKKPLHEDLGEYTIDAYDERLERVLQPYGASGGDKLKPMFLYYAEQQVHIPLMVPRGYEHLPACKKVVGGSGQVNRTVLCLMARRLDQSVGNLVALLKRNKMWEETLIFAISDNGGMTHWGDLFPASASSNWPLRGGKTTLFDGGVRVPAFAAGGALPSKARGTETAALFHASDVLPTLASAAGVPLLSAVDGLDAWTAICASPDHSAGPRIEVPINIGVNPLGGLPRGTPGILDDGGLNYSAIIVWPWKVIVGDPYITFMTQDQRRRDGWWIQEDGPEKSYEYIAPADPPGARNRLYNIENDPNEWADLAGLAEHKAILESLVDRIRWYASGENGWVKPQRNVPAFAGNPRFHNWTWSPFRRGSPLVELDGQVMGGARGEMVI